MLAGKENEPTDTTFSLTWKPGHGTCMEARSVLFPGHERLQLNSFGVWDLLPLEPARFLPSLVGKWAELSHVTRSVWGSRLHLYVGRGDRGCELYELESVNLDDIGSQAVLPELRSVNIIS